MEPNREAITKWVEALESEEFRGRQTRGKLMTPKGQRLCALGVRNYVFMREVLGVAPTGTMPATGYIDRQAKDWVGVPGRLVLGETDDGKPFGVIRANDRLKLTFREIAQHLRKRYL